MQTYWLSKKFIGSDTISSTQKPFDQGPEAFLAVLRACRTTKIVKVS
jgi:hypothetical protein